MAGLTLADFVAAHPHLDTRHFYGKPEVLSALRTWLRPHCPPEVLAFSSDARELRERFATHELATLYRRPDLHSGTGFADGITLYALTAHLQPRHSLEIGLAYGFSALFILQALHDNRRGQHLAIDPAQTKPLSGDPETSCWQGLGLSHIDRTGLGARFTFREAPSFTALPQILAEGWRGELALLDGMGLFDYLMTDFFYVDRLLKPGGVIALQCYNRATLRLALFALTNRGYRWLDVETTHLLFLRRPDADTRRWSDDTEF